jgi:uncharacterized membrane protein YfhO
VVPRRRAALAAVAFTTLLAADLIWFADGFHPLMPRQLAFPSTRETRLLQSDSNLFRVAGWMDALLPNTALVYGLRDVRSYDGMGVRSYSELLDVGFRYTGAIHQLVNVAHPQLLDLLNVKYILTPSDIDLPPDRFERVLDGPTRIYRNDRVQPRAFLADRYVVFRGNDARRAIRDTVDLTRTAVLESPLGAALQPEPALDDTGTTELRRYEDSVVSVITRAQGRRLLILTDVYYPGWVATVDRIEVPILRSDFAFRAVSVPAGDHVVEFRYRPASVRYGAWMSALGALFFVLVLFHRSSVVSFVSRDQSIGLMRMFL